MLRRTAINILLFAASTLFGATTYYVDPDSGNDANNGTSTGSAWAHLPGSRTNAVAVTGTGWAILTNGCSVIVKGGTTNFCQVLVNPVWYIGSNQFDSITIQSGHVASPQWGTTYAILDCSTNVLTNNTYGFWFTGNATDPTCAGITLDGFEVRNIPAGPVGNGFDNTGGNACVNVGGSYGASFFTVRRCYLHDSYRGSSDDQGHGIESGGVTNFIFTQNIIGTNIATKGIEPYRGVRGVISNNFVWGCGDHCISLTVCTNVDVCNNLIIGYGPHIHQPTYSIAQSGAEHCDQWNNLMFTVPPVSQTSSTNYPSLLYVYGRINPANAIFWNSQMGVGMYTTCRSNRILFNTIAFFEDTGNGGDSTAVVLGKAGSTGMDGTIIQSNMVFSNNNAFAGSFLIGQTNVATNTFVLNNNWYHNSASENIMGYHDGTAYHYTNVSGFVSPGTFTGNMQLLPVFVGGAFPTGLNSGWTPNYSYFQIDRASPIALLASAAPSADTNGGYDSSGSKFSTDIIGSQRSVFSLGAYEVLSAPRLHTGLRGISLSPK